MTSSYDQFGVRDFATDPAFINWVKHPDDASNAFWQAWLRDHPAKQGELNQARQLVLTFSNPTDVVTEQELTQDWETIGRRLKESAPVRSTLIRPLWQRSWTWAAAAAAVLLIIGINYWPQLTAPDRAENQTVAQRSASLKVINRTRQVVTQQLPDGSVVWMNPGSRLVYPRQFTANSRTVEFVGEGFFEVAKDAARPFTIYSGQLRTRVLGTSFNVKADAGSDTYTVSVVTGKVVVSAPTKNGSLKTVLLQPQQQALFGLKDQRLATSTVPVTVAKHEVWQPVSLSFDDVTLGEVARRLEQTFKTKITLSNPALVNCSLTVDFNQQRLAEILEQINKLLNTGYTLDGSHIVLTGNGCEP